MKAYELHPANDSIMTVQRVPTWINGVPSVDKICFHSTDHSQEEEIEVVSLISLEEAERLIGILVTLTKE